MRDFINDTLAGGEAALTAVQALYYTESSCPGAMTNMLPAASLGWVARAAGAAACSAGLLSALLHASLLLCGCVAVHAASACHDL